MDATCNWWGASNGPSGAGIGNGDSVQGNVTFKPWLTSAAPGGACNGGVDPLTANACKRGGWQTYGFRNQRQCIRFVNTGKDDRIGQ